MTPAQETKRSRGRPKGSKDRVARKSGLSINNDEARVSPTNSATSTPAPPAKRRASSSAGTPQPNGFTAINVGDRNTSRSGRSLSKTPKVAPQAVEPESLGPALKKRASARSTSRVSSTDISTAPPTAKPTPTTTPAPTEAPARKRLPDHGSQLNASASPAPAVAPSPTPPPGPNGYRSLYGQSPYGTPPPHGGPMYRTGPNVPYPNGQIPNGQYPNGQFSNGQFPNGQFPPQSQFQQGPMPAGPARPILYTQSYLQYPPVYPDHEPPINTIQPAPGSMSAPRMNAQRRTALPEQRRFPTQPIQSRSIEEILDIYQDLYKRINKAYKSFETFTWNVKIDRIDRNVFVKLAAMRSRRARLAYMVKNIKSLQKAGTTAMLIDHGYAVWPPVLDVYPTWHYALDTPGMKYELTHRINALSSSISKHMSEFERAMFMGQNLRVVKSTAIADEMKWLETQSQIKEYESLLGRLGDIDIKTHLTKDVKASRG